MNYLDQPGAESESKENKKLEYIKLAKELSERQESIPFPGVNSESYAIIKSEQEEFPGFATPIDELVERFKAEGMKVSLGNHPESGNVFIVPFGSDDIENDSLFPRHLMTVSDMDELVNKLILLNKK
jgi:hypothetical protein